VVPTWRVGTGKREGAPGMAWDSTATWHRLTGGPERHSAGRREFKLNSKIVQTDSKFWPNFD
jgi:hypothetical protein